MIPILYLENETNFNHNGIGQLHEVVDYEVTEVRNGEFELMLEYPVSGLWFSELTDLRIISAEPNNGEEPHNFRIYEIGKSLSTQSVIVYASSKTNDVGGNMVRSVTITNETGQQAMDKLKAGLIEPTTMNFVSDIQTKTSTKWENRNALNCIAGEQGSLIQYWGGEIKRTNDTIYLYSRRGKDNVAVIKPGKNLKGFDMTVSTKGLITAILPTFKMVPEDGTEQVTITGDVVYSPLAGNYPVSKITPVDYSGNESVTTLEELNAKASVYFSDTNPGCDEPKVKLTIDMMQLSDSSEYERFKDLEKIQLTDTVTVWVEAFDIDVVVKVTEVVYDGMRKMVKKLTAGTPSVTFYDSVRNTYSADINYLKDYLDSTMNGVRNQIQLTADGKNTIFRGYTEPSGDIAKPKDLWYKDIGSGNVEMFQYDGLVWQPLKITDAVFAEEMSITKFTAGELNAELVNLINLNASNITAGTLAGPNFWLNLLTSIMRFIDPETQETLDLDQAKIIFNAGTTYERIIEYTSEGLKFRPGPNNIGTNRNTSLLLEGAFGSHKYVNFRDWDDTYGWHTARLSAVGEVMRVHAGSVFEVRDNVFLNEQDAYKPIRASTFETSDSLNPTFLHADRWETPRYGNRGLVVSPNGTGKFYVANPEMTAYYPIWASSFDVSSSIEFKKAIEDYTGNATELIETTPVRKYHLNEDIEGVDVKRLGLIVQESPLDIVNTDGGQTIDLYQMTSLLWKSNQELSARLKLLENEGVIA